MIPWIAAGVVLLASLGFGAIQTWNLRHCQREAAKLAVAVEAQNVKVTEWEGKAKAAKAKEVLALKKAAETAKAAKEREVARSKIPGPSAGATCQEREDATLDLLRRYRRP